MRIIDISQLLDDKLPGWPRDTPFSYRLTWQRSAGSSVNVGAVTMSTHCGTHVDAPYHFREDGKRIDELPLDPFIGRALVVDLRGQSSISRRSLGELASHPAPRVLLRTDAWDPRDGFPTKIPVMNPDVPAWLNSMGVVLLGVDLPSVDDLESKDLPNHHAMARNGINILESLSLRDVVAGEYELVALPIKIAGGDAAPVRAVLIER